MNKVTILLNPSAGSGRAIKRLPELETALKRHGIDYSMPPLFDECHFKRMAAGRSIYEKLIVAAGGDGTFNAAANELIRNNRETTLGMINIGTRGDIAREFGTDTIDRACEAIRAFQDGKIKSYGLSDVGVVEAGTLSPIYFLGTASLGLENHIDRQLTEFLERHPAMRRFLGMKPFEIALGLYFANKSFKNGEVPISVKVAHDAGTLEAKTIAVIINNARYFDDGTIPSPGATPYDGKIDCCLIANAPRTTLVNDYRLMKQGRHTNRPEVYLIQSNRFSFSAPNGIGIQVDGEIIGKFQEVSVSVAPRKLKVLAHPLYSRG